MIRWSVLYAALLTVWTASLVGSGCSQLGSAPYVFWLDTTDMAIMAESCNLQSFPGGLKPDHGSYFLRMIFYNCSAGHYEYELENYYPLPNRLGSSCYVYLHKGSNGKLVTSNNPTRYRYDGFVISDSSLFVATDDNEDNYKYLGTSSGTNLEFSSNNRVWCLEPIGTLSNTTVVISPLQFATGCRRKKREISWRDRSPRCHRRAIRIWYKNCNRKSCSRIKLFLSNKTSRGNKNDTYKIIRLITYSTPINIMDCPTTISNCSKRAYTPYETVAINIPNTQLYVQPKTVDDLTLSPEVSYSSTTSPEREIRYVPLEAKEYLVKYSRLTDPLMPSMSGMDIREQSHTDLRMFKVHRCETGIRLESVLYAGYYLGVLTSRKNTVPIFINVKQSDTILSDPSIKLDLDLALPEIEMAPYPIPNTPSAPSTGSGSTGSMSATQSAPTFVSDSRYGQNRK